MSTLRAYKFLIIPVVQEIDEAGTVITEHQTQQPDQVFGINGLHVYAEDFPEVLARFQASLPSQNGHVPGVRPPGVVA